MMAHLAENDKHSDNKDTLQRSFIVGWLVLLVAIAAFVRIHGMGDWHLTADETVIRNMADGDSPAQVWQFSHDEAPAPLANVIRYYWMRISDDPTYLRDLSLVFGLMTIPLYYAIGRRLAGPLTGMACAALIAFSHGCIIQSYIVRNYSIFAFFLSCGFYRYLRWREGQGTGALLGYALWNCLSAFCNISTAFAVLCIAPLEALRLRRAKAPWRQQLMWAAANGAILMAAALIYVLWIPLLTPLHSYFLEYIVAPDRMLSHSLHYPLAVAFYIFPGHLFTVLLIPCILPFMMMRGKKAGAREAPFIYLLLVAAVLVGILLGVSNIYPYLGTRRSLWALPFFVGSAGLMIATTCSRFFGEGRKTVIVAGLVFLGLGWLFHAPEERFSDGSEYALTQKAWDDAMEVMQKLTPSDLIVTERDDGSLLANMYRPIGQDAFSGTTMMATMPWHGVSVLYNPYYPRNYSTAVFLANLDEARAKGLLDGRRNILFFRTAWSRSPLADLMICPALEKTVYTFPEQPQGQALTHYILNISYLSLMQVSARTLENDVLSPQGKARACLNGQNDMVPGFLTEAVRKKMDTGAGGGS